MPRTRTACKFFNTPRGCSNGDQCRYSHDCSNTTICNNFDIANQAGCSFGSACRFLHLPCETGFKCSACELRTYSGLCLACVPKGHHHMTTRQTSKILRDLVEQSEKANTLQVALAEEEKSHTICRSEINAILDSLQMVDAQTHTTCVAQRLCNICCDRAVSHALLPCGHCFCLVCIQASEQRCPICRKPASNSLALFF